MNVQRKRLDAAVSMYRALFPFARVAKVVRLWMRRINLLASNHVRTRSKDARLGAMYVGLSIPFLVASIDCEFATADEPTPGFVGVVQPFVARYCADCHGDKKAEGGIDLSSHQSMFDVLKHRKLWIEALHQLESQMMPPEGPKPSDVERQKMIAWIKDEIIRADWKKYADSGRVSMARLTTIEYRNSIRDIFGVELQAGIYLNKDSEGSTGFTNDRNNLSFPLFALQDYLREAERTVEAFMGYGEHPWKQTFLMKEEWEKRSDKPADLAEDESGVLLKDPINPFHFAVTVPFANLYRIEFSARTIDGEPLSGIEVIINGRSIEKILIQGSTQNKYELTVNLPKGFSNLSLLYSPDRAPIIQNKFEPRSVPEAIEKQIRKKTVPKLDVPEKLVGNKDAEAAYKRLNTVLAEYERTRLLAAYLLERGETDYEHHGVTKDSDSGIAQIRRLPEFKTTKVPLNLSAGKVALLLDIPQKELEVSIKKEFGFSHEEYVRTINAYNKAFAEKHPERVRKVAGKVIVEQVSLSSHALSANDESPEWVFSGPDDANTARSVVSRFAERAYRRPPTNDQLKRLEQIYEATFKETQSHREALSEALVGLLVSPSFLMRFACEQTHPERELDGYDFASRLAAFLWLSIPDRQLTEMSLHSKLDDNESLKSVLDHLLSNRRFEDFCSAFVEQWLNLQNIEEVNVNLLEAMRTEPVLAFCEMVRENRSILELIDSDHTWLNNVLADHYGIEGVESHSIRPVPLPDDRRGGLVTMAAVLATTSTTERTSPVMRGAWIVETLLGERLPPPPPSVPELVPDAKKQTVREALELHRQTVQCSGCHNKIDPFGFVLENYDRLGAWREQEGRKSINAETILEDGTRLNGIAEFKKYLLEKRARDFARNLTERMLAFALGREIEFYDEALIQNIVNKLEANSWKSHTLLREIIRSDAFRKQNDTGNPLGAQ